MSFTENVKNELARVPREGSAERKAELLALLRMSGTVVTGPQRSWGLELSTGNSAVARRVLTCLKQDWSLIPTAMVRQGRKLRKKNVYTVVVPPTPESQRFIEEGKLFPLAKISDRETFRSDGEKRAYLAGAFLGGGSVNRPQGDYHLEMVTRSGQFAQELLAVMHEFDLRGRLTDRKNDYIVYVKEGESVANFLQVIGATQSYLDFEGVRVVKDMRNRVNRQVNCETANLQKTVNAAVRQGYHAELVLSRYGSSLKTSLRETCELRLAHPNASLAELSAICGVSKSGLAHRFRKIASLAEASIKERRGLS